MQSYLGKIILAVIMVCTLFTTCTAEDSGTAWAVSSASSIAMATSGDMVFQKIPVAGTDVMGNYTKLEIMPSYMNFVVEPGEKKEMTVTVRNRDTKTAHVEPMIRQQPYAGLYVADNSWIDVTPARADIPAGESAKFTFTVLVPTGTLRGSYSTTVAFTDETYPTSYPQTSPNYIHTLGLNINVASSPIIQIATPYISDQLESGGEYTYSIDVKNKGSTPLTLNPKLGDDSYPMYGPYGPVESLMDVKAFTISAPATIPPGRNGTVTVKVNVPQNASGYFNGNVDLGIDDPSIRLEENRIQLNFLIWKQPTGGFSKVFAVPAQEPIKIELTSAMPMMYPVSVSGTSANHPRREPTFDATLTGPGGATNLVLVEKVIRGSVNMGTDPLLTNGDLPGQYQETSSQYIFTYSAQGTPGTWTLAVMPKNTQSFEYKITLGKEKTAEDSSFFTLPFGLLTTLTLQ